MLFGKLFTNPKMWVNGDADDITMGGVYTCKDVQNVPTGDGALFVFKTENTVKQVFIPVGEEGVVYTRVLGEEWASVTGTSEETEALIQSAIDKANQAQAKADTVDTRLNNIIVESGTSDAEVVAARTDSSGQTFTTLGVRLDTQFGAVDDTIKSITEQGLIDTSKLHVTQYWIDPSNNILDGSISIPKRLVIIPIEANSIISVSIPTLSTKRVAFCNSLTDGSPVYGVQQITGALNAKFTNTSYKYFVIQLFINSDTDMDYTHYLDSAEISVFTAIDSIARKNINTLLGSGDLLFHTENLKGLPILDHFSDIEIVTNAYDNSTNFHNLVKSELCDTSNGYLVQTLLGNDGHDNNLYKYVTYPETLTYGAARRFGTPEHPIYDGFPTSVFTVIVTTNIHGVEHGSNWVIYNLLKKILTEDSDMIRFFRKRVKLIWVPYICASGNYENAEGVNINRDFPTTKGGTCTSIEGNLVKGVIDEYGNIADLHLDIHTFDTNGAYAKYFASWSFTDSEKLGNRSVLVADRVCAKYSEKYPDINLFKKEVVSAINTPTTCTYYTQTVYGVPSGTVEGALLMEGSPEGTSAYTSATAYLYDIVTQTICAMV